MHPGHPLGKALQGEQPGCHLREERQPQKGAGPGPSCPDGSAGSRELQGQWDIGLELGQGQTTCTPARAQQAAEGPLRRRAGGRAPAHELAHDSPGPEQTWSCSIECWGRRLPGEVSSQPKVT